MIKSIYEHAIIIDTSAVIAYHDSRDNYHKQAVSFFSADQNLKLYVLDVTSHECFTTVRYKSDSKNAFAHYHYLRRNDNITLIRFNVSDEEQAETLLKKYSDKRISFHDALCVAAMKRTGIFKVLTFDQDFFVLGLHIGLETYPLNLGKRT